MVRYSVHFENIAAGNGASGVSSLPGDSCLSRVARGAAQLVEAAVGGCVSYSHVSAHEGHAWNELADTVAKTILGVLSSGGPSVPPPPRTVVALARCINWDWAWMYVQPHLAAAFPRVSEGLMSWDLEFEAPTVRPCDLLPMRPCVHSQHADACALRLRVFSLNVQSLKDKHRYIKEQAEAHGCSVLLLQETKTNDSFCETSRYLRFASPVEQRWGTAIWIRKWQQLDEDWYPVQRSDTSQVVCKPRILGVLLRVSVLTVLFLSVHLPQQQRDLQERPDVLTDVAGVLKKYQDVHLVVLGIDANARVPCSIPHVTGEVPFGVPDSFGDSLVEFLDLHHLYIPSTFEGVHAGPSHTWKHPSGSLARIDFICVRSTVSIDAESSWTCETLDHLVQQEDHASVVWEAVVSKREVAEGPARLNRCQFDRRKLMSEEGQAILAAELCKYAPPSWKVHPTDHAAHMEQFLQPILQRHFLKPVRGPRAGFICEDIWASRDRCQRLRKHTRRWNEGHQQFVRFHSLHRWKAGCGEFAADVTKHLVLRELFASAIKFATHQMRRRLRQDKRVYMQKLSKSLEGMTAPEVQKSLRLHGIGGKAAKRTQRFAPCRRDPATGTPVLGAREMDDAWLTFFGDMEYGSVLGVEDLHNVRFQRPQNCCAQISLWCQRSRRLKLLLGRYHP